MSEILSVSDVSIEFRSTAYHRWTWRDLILGNRMMRKGEGSEDRVKICEKISFQVREGDRVALLGHNGVGKTSLCRCIAGYFPPATGKIQRLGTVRAIFDLAVSVNPELTGRENARLFTELMFAREQRMDESLREALEFSGLGSHLDMPFRVYSRGMQSRLLLSLVSMRPADLLILDEVFDGADLSFQGKISERIIALALASRALIFVSHNPDQVRRVCNRAILLENGRIRVDGTVEEALDMQATLMGLPQPMPTSAPVSESALAQP